MEQSQCDYTKTALFRSDRLPLQTRIATMQIMDTAQPQKLVSESAKQPHAKATSSDEPFVNIAGYKFVMLDRLTERRQRIRDRCIELQLKGTILLAPEGINLFVAGRRCAIDDFLAELRSDEPFADFEVKESPSDDQPFSRMLVRLKKEIIAFGVEGIDPQHKTSPRVSAKELRNWLDNGDNVTLLDVRNDYEIEIGTFENAVQIGIDHFRHFPDEAKSLPTELKKHRIVTFCTGGIRCEKAAPYLEQLGFEQVYQLDGGILKYFEECGSEHYDGDCFVFDKRVAVNAELTETAIELCYACQATLSPDDQESDKYVPGKSCPHCFQATADSMQQLIDGRNAAIAQAANPLPGSMPYDNIRPFFVTQRFAGQKLLDALCELQPHIRREDWQAEIESGRIRYQDAITSTEQTLVAGQRYDHVMPNTVEPDVDAAMQVIYEDEWIVGVNKPAPLPMHPCGRFNRNSLQYILARVYSPLKLRIAHRLDANTTGVVVLSKTGQVAAKLQPMFERGEIGKEYLVRVQGHWEFTREHCTAPISATPTNAGARVIDQAGLPAHTEFEFRRLMEDGTTLLTARPKTGRTNQIRIHLWDLGYPVCGDPLYLPDGELGDSQTLSVSDPPLCLHARRLQFQHPITGTAITLTAPEPAWCQKPRNSVVE